MRFTIILGILLIATFAFSARSFAVPFGKIRVWLWETYWMGFSIGAYIIVLLLACLVFTYGFRSVNQRTPSKTITLVFFPGAVYGIGNLSFGLLLRYPGLSLGYALSLGLMLAPGTLIPFIFDGRLKVMIGIIGSV